MTDLEYASTTTARTIREKRPYTAVSTQLDCVLNSGIPEDKPISLLFILNTYGWNNALSATTFALPDDRLHRHFWHWCAKRVLHLYENVYPDDSRVRKQVEILRNDNATAEARKAVMQEANKSSIEASRNVEWVDVAEAKKLDPAKLDPQKAAKSAACAGALSAAQSATGGGAVKHGVSIATCEAVRATHYIYGKGVAEQERAAQERQLRKMLAQEKTNG